jgi:hypothetical protein
MTLTERDNTNILDSLIISGMSLQGPCSQCSGSTDGLIGAKAAGFRGNE